MGERAFYFDFDGFFWPSDKSDIPLIGLNEGISYSNDPQPIRSLIEQYYLGFRSSIFFLVSEGGNDNETLGLAYKKLCKLCLTRARQFAFQHLQTGSILPIDYMCFMKCAIVNQLKDDYPEVRNVKISIDMRPRITARTINNTIVFPALLRTIINSCNIAILNIAYDTLEKDKQFSRKASSQNPIEQSYQGMDRQFIARSIFPYLAFCHDDFSVANLPVTSAQSRDAITLTLRYSKLQLLFVLAHEYAHILLGHYDKMEHATRSSIELEYEADNFATDFLMKYIEEDGTFSREDVFTSIRWLYKFQLIEEHMGLIVQNKSLQMEKSALEKRRHKFQTKLIKEYGINHLQMIDQAGFIAIIQSHKVLFENGETVVNRMMDSITKSLKTGEIEPWWEMIRNI